MPKLILKIFTALIFWGVFGYVIFQVPYPNGLTQASIYQMLAFFIPLFLALTFTLNIFLTIPKSIIISFGLIILLILKALGSLNLVSAGLTIIATGLLFSYFKKSSLNSESKIPKLRSLRRRR